MANSPPAGAPGQYVGSDVAHNPYTFKGGIKDDPTGLIKFGQRWFNSTTGAWTQQDTLGAPLDPANANRYAYAGDDPINNNDPGGRTTLTCVLDVSSAIGDLEGAAGAVELFLDGFAGEAIGVGEAVQLLAVFGFISATTTATFDITAAAKDCG